MSDGQVILLSGGGVLICSRDQMGQMMAGKQLVIKMSGGEVSASFQEGGVPKETDKDAKPATVQGKASPGKAPKGAKSAIRPGEKSPGRVPDSRTQSGRGRGGRGTSKPNLSVVDEPGFQDRQVNAAIPRLTRRNAELWAHHQISLDLPVFDNEVTYKEVSAFVSKRFSGKVSNAILGKDSTWSIFVRENGGLAGVAQMISQFREESGESGDLRAYGDGRLGTPLQAETSYGSIPATVLQSLFDQFKRAEDARIQKEADETNSDVSETESEEKSVEGSEKDPKDPPPEDS